MQSRCSAMISAMSNLMDFPHATWAEMPLADREWKERRYPALPSVKRCCLILAVSRRRV